MNAPFHLSAMSLEIARVVDAGPLPSCTPSLMPFCISYTGPAPVSRYFRPRPAPPSLAVLSARSSSSATLVASSSSTSILSETKSSLTAVPSTTSVGSLAHESECGDESLSKTSIGVINQVEDAAMGMDSETQPALDVIPLNNSSRSARVHTPGSRNVERFVVAFRGRQMYGQAMDIPSGYGGVVLRAPSDSKGKGKEDAEAAPKSSSQKVKPKSKTRAATLRSKRATVEDTADELEEGDDGDCCPDPDADPPLAKKLIPSSTFTSFMLWTPDRPLDEGRDEYARALVEWTHLATEVSSLQCWLYILMFVTSLSRRYMRMMDEINQNQSQRAGD